MSMRRLTVAVALAEEIDPALILDPAGNQPGGSMMSGIPFGWPKRGDVVFHFPGGTRARNYRKVAVMPGEWDVEPTQSGTAHSKGDKSVVANLHLDVWFVDKKHVLRSVMWHLGQHFLAKARQLVNQILDVVRRCFRQRQLNARRPGVGS